MAEAEAISFTLESDGLAGTPIQVASATIVERMNEPFVARVTLSVLEPDADVAQMVGKSATLTIERGGGGALRHVHGIVAEVELGEPPAPELRARATWATATVVPAFWLLDLCRNTRIFQEKTAIEILEAVLGPALSTYGRELRVATDATYPTREYCVQYQESDRAFAERLIEEEGIAYSFDHEGDAEVLVLRDRNAAHPQTPTQTGSIAIPFRPQAMDLDVDEPILEVRARTRDTTTSVVVRDWDWTRPSMPFDEEARSEDAHGRDRERYEHGWGESAWITDYAGTAYGKDDAARQASVRREAHARDAASIEVVSRVVGMAPGTRFEVSGHPTPGYDGEYFVTGVSHHADARRADAEGKGYVNSVEALPVATPYRPRRRRRKPAIAGVQTAVVTGPAGEEIHVDEHGRVKVQFHWDREGANDDRSSCWIRVRQPWAGAGWGFWWVPRIGMEVVVHFVDGDPDRPMISGSVYDGTNALPYPLPGDKTKSTIKSNSSLGGGGFNEFRFEDLAGQEEIYTHAQKDYNEVVEHDHTTWVGNDQTNEVDVDQTQTIHKNQVEQVDGNQELSVGGNRSVHVKGNFDETVDGTETRHVVGDVKETFDANETRTITGDVTETFAANETRTLSANQTETVNGSQSRTITGASTVTITGALSQTVMAGIKSTTPAAHTIIAVGGFSVTTPATITLTAPAGATFIAPAGFTQIDQGEDWLGTLKKAYSPLAWSVFTIQMEAVDILFQFTNIKIELGVVTCTKDHVDLKTLGPKIRNQAVRLKSGISSTISAIKNRG
ncbi:MAG: type VI secretion system tip protein VgrG [Sandaracinaceae bacterium]|nr:type VI secretion system tip protein VgrG [Sandaracinaceae bacterium]